MFCFIYLLTHQTPLKYLVVPTQMKVFFDVQVPSLKVDEVRYKSFFLIGRSHWEPTLAVI